MFRGSIPLHPVDIEVSVVDGRSIGHRRNSTEEYIQCTVGAGYCPSIHHRAQTLVFLTQQHHRHDVVASTLAATIWKIHEHALHPYIMDTDVPWFGPIPSIGGSLQRNTKTAYIMM